MEIFLCERGALPTPISQISNPCRNGDDLARGQGISNNNTAIIILSIFPRQFPVWAQDGVNS